MLKFLAIESGYDYNEPWLLAEYRLLDYLRYIIEGNKAISLITPFMIWGGSGQLGYITYPDCVELKAHGYTITPPAIPWSYHEGEFLDRMARENGQAYAKSKLRIVKGTKINVD